MSLLLLFDANFSLPADTIRFLRGPYSLVEEAAGVLDEGEACEAGIVLADNSCFEMLFLGGHDNANHLVGGGFQIVTSLPTFDAPDGAACIYNGTLYTCLSNVWSPLGGGGGDSAFGYYLASGDTVTIPAGRFGFLCGNMEIDGHVELDGRIVEIPS